jgi:hypothetical protein
MKKQIIAFAICCSLGAVFFSPLSSTASAANRTTPSDSSIVMLGDASTPVPTTTTTTQTPSGDPCSNQLEADILNQIATMFNSTTGTNGTTQGSSATQSNVCPSNG